MVRLNLAFKHRYSVLSICTLKIKNKKMLDGSEKSMIPIIASNGNVIIGSYKKMVHIEEFSAGTGIADIVLCSYDPRAIKSKKTRPLTDRRILEAYLLLLEFDDGLSIKNIHAQLGYSHRELKNRIIPGLIESGLLSVDEDNYKLHARIEDEGFNKVVAVEAKVKDWRSGFRQAIRYQEFADESYLAVYERFISPCLEFKGAFERAGIGLLGVSDKGLSVHIKASDTSCYNKHVNRILAHERISTFLDGANQPFVIRQPFSARV